VEWKQQHKREVKEEQRNGEKGGIVKAAQKRGGRSTKK